MWKKIGLTIVCLMLLLPAGCGKSTEQQIAEQLELGQRYLTERNYEQAIVAFNKVINIEPKAWNAYIALSEIYTEQGSYSDSADILEQGLILAEGDDLSETSDLESIETMRLSFKELCTSLAEEAEAQGDNALAVSWYEKILAFDNDKEISGKKEKAEKVLLEKEEKQKFLEKNEAYLSEIYDVFEQGDDDQIQAVMASEKYAEMRDSMQWDYFYYSKADKNITLGIFPKRYCYFGEVKGETREGDGSWYSCNSTTWFGYYKGEWKDDEPNGKGECYRNTRNGIQYIEGEYLNGLENGIMSEKNLDKSDGESRSWYATWTSMVGERQPLPVPVVYNGAIREADVGEYYYAIGKETDSEHELGCSAHYGDLYGVYGWQKIVSRDS